MNYRKHICTLLKAALFLCENILAVSHVWAWMWDLRCFKSHMQLLLACINSAFSADWGKSRRNHWICNQMEKKQAMHQPHKHHGIVFSSVFFHPSNYDLRKKSASHLFLLSVFFRFLTFSRIYCTSRPAPCLWPLIICIYSFLHFLWTLLTLVFILDSCTFPPTSTLFPNHPYPPPLPLSLQI